MYCPKCGAQNADNASFCRGCGTNLSLVPQALTGRLPEARYDDDSAERSKKRRREGPPSMESAIKHVCMGIGFLCAALWVLFEFPAGIFWGWTFFIPAFSMLGKGLGEYARLRQGPPAQPLTAPSYVPPAVAPPQRGGELPPRPAADIYTPTSVTENTTQLLDHDR